MPPLSTQLRLRRTSITYHGCAALCVDRRVKEDEIRRKKAALMGALPRALSSLLDKEGRPEDFLVVTEEALSKRKIHLSIMSVLIF